MATVKVQRTKEFSNGLRKYGIYIDGQKAGTIANGEIKEFTVAAGRHVIYSKIDWCTSPEIVFDITNENTRSFKVSAFKNAGLIMGLAAGVIALGYYFKYTRGEDYFYYLAIPGVLVIFYFLTFGRKKYLSLSETALN